MAAISDLDENHISRNSTPNFTKNKVYAMFGRIIKGNGSNIKSQQRTETDLTNEEKQEILFKQYEKNPGLFLVRFGRYLVEEDFECFSGNCEIDYLVKKLRKSLSNRTCGTEMKNRRYEAMVRLETKTDYFSEENMRERCPLLYEQYIGQFMTAEEKLERDEKQMCGEVKMSSFIFQQMDREWLQSRENVEREQEEECMEEEEEEEEVNSDKKEDTVEWENTKSELTDISEEEKLHYHQEFLQIMKHNFLAGLDRDFDYSKVDTNEEYDNLEIINQDAEDKYFDDEEPDVENKDYQETMSNDSEEDYLSDKILQKCSTTS